MNNSSQEPAQPSPSAAYGKKVFETLLELSGQGTNSPWYENLLVIEEDGVHPKSGFSPGDLSWTPACDLNGPGCPDPLDMPGLPFPFTAAQLAAWMLDGAGFFLREEFGGWDNGPFEDMLPDVDFRWKKGREAIVCAFAAYRSAKKVVGEEVQVHISFPRGLDKNEYKELRELQERPHREWRQKMVMALLQPGGTVELRQGDGEGVAAVLPGTDDGGSADRRRAIDAASNANSQQESITVRQVRIRARSDVLTKPIEDAIIQLGGDPRNGAVWAWLVSAARSYMLPFTGEVNAGGIKFRDNGGKVKLFTREALSDRMRRWRLANTR